MIVGPCPLGPDRREMCLAGAWRPEQKEKRVGPLRPGLDHGERRFIAGRGQKILAAEMRRQIEVERKLR